MNWCKAVLAAIFTPPLLGALYYFYLTCASKAPFNQTVFWMTISSFYVFVLLVGIPAVLAINPKKGLPLRQCIFTGIAISVLTASLLAAFSAALLPLSQLAAFSFLGALAGLSAWFVFR